MLLLKQGILFSKDNIVLKFLRKLLKRYIESTQWGYEKRYLYRFDHIEHTKNGIYIKFHVRGKKVPLHILLNNLNNVECLFERFGKY